MKWYMLTEEESLQSVDQFSVKWYQFILFFLDESHDGKVDELVLFL